MKFIIILILLSSVSTTAQTISSFKALSEKNIYMQEYDNTCGLASMLTLLKMYGETYTENELSDMLIELKNTKKNSKKYSYNFSEFKSLFIDLGYIAEHYKNVTYETLKRINTPALIHLQLERNTHFSIFNFVDDYGFVHLLDSSQGKIIWPEQKFKKHFTGKIIAIAHKNKIINIPKDSKTFDNFTLKFQ